MFSNSGLGPHKTIDIEKYNKQNKSFYLSTISITLPVPSQGGDFYAEKFYTVR